MPGTMRTFSMPGSTKGAQRTSSSCTAMVVFGVIMLGIQVYVFFGPPPASDKAAAATALIGYAVFALVIRVLERRAVPGLNE